MTETSFVSTLAYDATSIPAAYARTQLSAHCRTPSFIKGHTRARPMTPISKMTPPAATPFKRESRTILIGRL